MNKETKEQSIEDLKNHVARIKGYPSWGEMMDFIIDNNMPINVAILIFSAMDDVFELLKAGYSSKVQEGLREVSSMTVVEFRAMESELSFDVVKSAQTISWKDKKKHVLVLENRINTNSLTFNDGEILLKYGFSPYPQNHPKPSPIPSSPK